MKQVVKRLAKFPDSLSLGTKLVIGISILILILSGVLSLGLYWQLHNAQRQAIEDRLYDLLGFSAPLVDGDFHSLIRLSKDENSSFYRVIFSQLKEIQETSDIIEHIYTLRQHEDGRLIYVVDVDSQDHNNFGQEYLRPSPILEKGITNISGPVVENSFHTDSTGTFLSGYVPIYDQFNELDGILGIDINVAGIIAHEARARRIALIAFLVAVPISIILGGWLVRKLFSPMNELVAGAERIGKGQFDVKVPVHSQDELGILANAFNKMAKQLQQTMQSLELQVAKYANGQKLQETMYRISQAAISTTNLDELYLSIHSILGELIPVENFYIALFNPTTETISFPYYVDQHDQRPPAASIGRGLTEYVLRTRQSLLVTPEILASLIKQGEVSLVGTKPVDWMGVPLSLGENIIGVMGVQSYSKEIRFTQENMDLMEFVSTQIAQTIIRKKADEELTNSNKRYYQLFEDSPISLWEEDFSTVKMILDSIKESIGPDIRPYLASHPEVVADCSKQIRILDVNKATLVLFGAKSKEEIIRNTDTIFSEESFEAFQDELVYIAEGRTEFTWEGVNKTLDGKLLDISIKWSVFPGCENDLSRVIISMDDITERREFESRLTYLGTHDGLTGLYNRGYFEKEMARLERNHQVPISIIMADVDNLKTTNDIEGHAVGDIVLQEVTRLLLSSFRAVDTIARIGGDEFAVLLPDTNQAAAERALLRIKNNLQSANVERPELHLGLSLGVSTVDEAGSLEEVLDQADKNMYLDKQSKNSNERS